MLKSREIMRGKNRGIFKTSPLAGEVGASLRVRGNTNITTDTKLASPAPVILGPVPRILLQRVSNLINKLALLLHKCWLREDSSMTGGRGANSFGRSMIEMLGVLAIIGVLSVGGIAGYSKAMEQFRINKAISEYSMLIYGMLEHLDDFKKTQVTTDTLQALNIIPQSWNKIGNQHYKDSYGNMIQVWSSSVSSHDDSGVLILDFYLGGLTKTSDSKNISANFSAKLCMEIYQKIAIPLHAAVWDASIYKSRSGSITIDGDKACDGEQKCLTNITLAEIHSICNACARSSEACAIVMHF